MTEKAPDLEGVESLAPELGVEPKGQALDEYSFTSNDIPITITVSRIPGEYVPIYEVKIASISRTTEFILERIRQELIKHVNLGLVDITDVKKSAQIEEKFKGTIRILIDKYLPDADDTTKGYLNNYLITKALGLGNLELVMADDRLEEAMERLKNALG